MKFEIKNLKYSAFNSNESHCFEATVYVDGKRFCMAHDDGYGGCIDFRPLGKTAPNDEAFRKRVGEINEWIKAQGPAGTFHDGSPMYKNLEWVVNDLVNDALVLKEAKAILRRVSFLDEAGDIRQLKAKYKPSAKVFDAIRNAPWWSDSCHILNELPVDVTVEALRAS